MSINEGRVNAIIEVLIPAVGDTSMFGQDVLEHSLQTALLWHSQFLPRRAVMMGTGDGSTTHWDLPDDLIYVRKVESPYGEAPPVYLPGTEWQMHQGSVNFEIILADTVGSGDVFAVHYAGEWTIDLLKSKEDKAMAHLACAFICTREATRMAHSVSPIIEAEVVNYRDLSRSWLNLYGHFVGLYAQFYGLSAARVKAGAPPYAFAVGAAPLHQRYRRFWWVT